jgi:MFS family permease
MDKQFRLFLGCFIALVATAFGFAVRAAILEDWRTEFGLSSERLGYLGGVGLYPFAISIILFSLIVDKIGYGRAMVFAFVGHFVSALMTIYARNFTMLYWATFLYALANGTVEAVINPVVASMYDRNKTHWLNILHAGWPGGLALGGLLAIGISLFMGQQASGTSIWRWQMAIVLIPTIGYGILLVGQKFPVQERVAAGVSYVDMLREFGWGSAYICFFLLLAGANQIGITLERPAVPLWQLAGIAVIPTVIFGVAIKSFGRPMFVFLLLIMVLLATTELGTDSWIADIMRSVLGGSQVKGTLFLVWTAVIMFVLRFFAGPIVHRISPLGLLACCAAIASVGLLWLSGVQVVCAKLASLGLDWFAGAEGMVAMLIMAATLYGLGKTFFWPTTLGLVSEQYPKGGALMLNAIAGVGMIAVGTIGNPAIGFLQDRAFDQRLLQEDETLHADLVTMQPGLFGEVNRPDREKVGQINDRIAELRQAEQDSRAPGRLSDIQLESILGSNEDYQELRRKQTIINEVDRDSKQGTLAKIAVLPAIMFCCYVILIFYFRSKGGYQAQILTGHAAEDEEFTGGVEGPMEA